MRKKLDDPAAMKVRERMVRMIAQRDGSLTSEQWAMLEGAALGALVVVDTILPPGPKSDAAQHAYACAVVCAVLITMRAKRMEYGLADAGVTFEMSAEALLEIVQGQMLQAVKAITSKGKDKTT
jgi:hypothetical protein